MCSPDSYVCARLLVPGFLRAHWQEDMGTGAWRRAWTCLLKGLCSSRVIINWKGGAHGWANWWDVWLVQPSVPSQCPETQRCRGKPKTFSRMSKNPCQKKPLLLYVEGRKADASQHALLSSWDITGYPVTISWLSGPLCSSCLSHCFSGYCPQPTLTCGTWQIGHPYVLNLHGEGKPNFL